MNERAIRRRYADPLDVVWSAAAVALGLRVARDPAVFASSDGRGTLTIGTPETLDADDCLAQMVFHEICHALVEGPSSLGQPDWGLCNVGTTDLPREHAALRVQAALAQRFGLRAVLAPTTEHRAYYDRLPANPLADVVGDGDEVTAVEGAVIEAAREALGRTSAPPWDVVLRALARTRAIVAAAREAADELAAREADASEAALLFVDLQ